jgi:hypothetical protein
MILRDEQPRLADHAPLTERRARHRIACDRPDARALPFATHARPPLRHSPGASFRLRATRGSDVTVTHALATPLARPISP